MKHHETVVIRCDDIGAGCGDVVARWGDVVARWGDVGARRGDVGARRGDVGDRAEFPAISARSLRRLRSWYNSADV